MSVWERLEAATPAFLEELTELTRKHGIVLWGCGCCASPTFYPLDDEEAAGRYVFADPLGDRADLEWITPNEQAERERRRAAVSRKEPK